MNTPVPPINFPLNINQVSRWRDLTFFMTTVEPNSATEIGILDELDQLENGLTEDDMIYLYSISED